MAMGVMNLVGSCVPSGVLCSLQQPSFRPTVSGKTIMGLRASSPTIAAARALASSSSSCFSGVSLAPSRSVGWAVTQRGSVVKVRAGKTALGCTKRSRSRKSLARTSGFRVRLLTPGGRNVLKRRRAKGRKVLCPCSNPSSGKRA